MAQIVRTAPAYTDADRVKGLSALIRSAGDATKAAKELKRRGLDVTDDTLVEWRDKTHSTLYVTLAEEAGRAIEEMAAARMRENALRATTIEADALDVIGRKLAENPNLTDASRALDAVQKARSTGIDRVLSLTGRPVNGQSQDPKEIERTLIRLGVLKPAIEGTATEVQG